MLDYKAAVLVQSALNIMHLAHSGQTDRSGEPYTGHTFRVGMRSYQLTGHIYSMCVGFLHDVIEDCPDWTVDRLIQSGIPYPVANSVSILTRQSGESYADTYIGRIIEIETPRGDLGRPYLAWRDWTIRVKIADLEDNIGRPGATPEMYVRYLKALHRLRGTVKNPARIPVVTPSESVKIPRKYR